MLLRGFCYVLFLSHFPSFRPRMNQKQLFHTSFNQPSRSYVPFYLSIQQIKALQDTDEESVAQCVILGHLLTSSLNSPLQSLVTSLVMSSPLERHALIEDPFFWNSGTVVINHEILLVIVLLLLLLLSYTVTVMQSPLTIQNALI